jgi:hypothetical protein
MAGSTRRRPGRQRARGGPPRAVQVAVAKRVGALLVVGLALTGCAGARDAGIVCDFNRPGIAARLASHTLARLQRTGCLGWCPEYVVAIDVDGEVTYLGRHNVMTQGPATDRLSADQLRSLREAVLRSRQVEMPQEQCTCGCVSDAPDVELTTWEKEVPRTVRYDEGCEQAPPAIRMLEIEIDRVVGIERWIGTHAARKACFVEHRDCESLVGVPEATP